MAITITGVKRDGDIAIRMGKTRGRRVLEFTEHYHVYADNIENVMWEVMRTAVPNAATAPLLPINGLPLPGHTIALDGICICKTVTGSRDEKNPRKWTFTANFSSEVEIEDGGGPEDPNFNPETISPSREVMFETIKRYRITDYIGRGYTNGANMLLNPAMEVEDEISRWEFEQFEPVHLGGGSTVNRQTHTSHNGIIYPPGVYSSSANDAFLVGFTDNTVNYFNGAINVAPFRGLSPFTLQLKVRKSTEGFFFGMRRRLTEYSITYDPQNWLNKVVNAGPFFISNKLDADGNAVVGQTVAYPYIYYTKDIEDEHTDLSQDQMGPLGSGVNEAHLRTTSGAGYTAWPTAQGPIWYRNAATISDGVALAGAVLVTTASGKKTYRANRPADNTNFKYIEYLNQNLLDFNTYIRVR